MTLERVGSTGAGVAFPPQTLFTDAEGTFSKTVPRGIYRISTRIVRLVGYYGGDHGFATSVGRATAVDAVTSDVTGIVISYGFISGTVQTLDGQPAFAAHVGINSTWRVARTGLGTFRLPVPTTSTFVSARRPLALPG